MKSEIRSSAMMRRDAIALEDREQKEKYIFAHLKSLPLGEHVFIYKSIRSEASMDRMIEWLAKKEISTYLPRTDFRDHSMLPVKYHPGDELTEKPLGLLEPQGAALEDLSLLTAIVVPMVGYDLHLNRLGYGGGFYDRFLPRAPQALRIGIAFSEQEVDSLLAEDTDIPMDFIATDKGLLIGKERSIPHLIAK